MVFRFDPDVLEACVREGVGLDPEAAMDRITERLAERYPGLIDTGPRRWVMNNAGGAMGQLTLLHGSLSEYIIFFGTPIGTEGHSGRYLADVYDWVFDGEMWCYVEGDTQRRVYEPGSRAYLGGGQVKGYRVPDHAWMLEYARGIIPTMLPFGLADSFVSTLDGRSIGTTIRRYGALTVRSLLRGKI